jgi:hypothetical protein
LLTRGCQRRHACGSLQLFCLLQHALCLCSCCTTVPHVR